MELRSASVSSMDNNAYLVVSDGVGLLIDAAADADALSALVGDVPVQTIVTTHRHHDHVRALKEMASRTGARLVAGAPDADAIASAARVAIDERVWDGDRVRVGSVELEVIGLVGHTPGSIALAVAAAGGEPAHVFSGDALFPGGVGRTTTPADFDSLYRGVVEKIFDRFGDDTVVHPGHGKPTTLGAERPHLEEWRARGW